ncbi:MAG: Ig-like domain-containing protein, partial [Myxococcota bacterium]|nr:Ig-like domain-containing protein [Myxococcota bacterium]
TAGGVASIEVALPHADDTPVAGEAFPVRLTLRDERGNPTDGAVASVTLVERCGDADTRFRRSVVFADEIELSDAYLTGATGPEGCAANGLEVIGQADGAALQGSSRDVMVQPGQPDGLRLQVFPPVIQVGESPVLVVVEAEDAWGNKTTSVEGSLQLEDSEGGLGLEAGAYECQSMVAGVATCEASPVRAADAVLVTATMVDGLAGTAPPLTVLAGAADRLDVVVSPPTVAAGDLFDLRLRTVDAWGNPVGIDPTGTDVPVFEDGEASVSCAWTGSEGSDGEERFACAATHAEPTKTIHVALPAGATGTSPPFEVTNGPLADATLDLGGVRELTAGDPLDLSVQARDTWGNPYIVQTVSSVDIYDKSGEVVAEPVALDGGGAGTLRLRPTVAWASNQLDAYAGTALLGRSSAFDVIAGAAVDLGVELPATWAEVGEPVPVKVIAEDAYGNPVRGFSGTVVLRSSLSAADDASASVFDEGVANAVMQWERVALQDTIRAEGGGLSGVSAGVDAVQRCEGGGPTAELEIGGDLDHVTCRVGGITPFTNLDASGSTPGSTALLATHFAPSAGTWLRVSATSTNVTWDSVGANEVRAVVVDIAGCFDDTTARAWVGDSDGEPVGPVSLSPASTTLVAGSTTLGSTTVDISATDCAGDPASGGTLAVRADLGALSSGSSMLTATGAGLELALDASGHGQVTWSMTTTAHDGVATLHAGTPAGSAHGTTTGSVSGEFAPPTVVTAEPSGTRSGTFSAVHLTFSEEMLGSSLTTSTVALTAPDGTLVPDLALSMADTTLTMTLDSPQDAGSGVWSIGVGSGARDLAGNRLDGAWTGGSSAFLLTFGLVPDIAPDMTDCVAATTTIRPDGDDGSGDESDDLEVALQATGTPAWWEILVLDDDDGLVFAEREAGSAAAMTVSWNGRDQRGMVVEEGRYSVRFTPMDASWNPGDGCTVPVTVAHRVAAPRGAP